MKNREKKSKNKENDKKIDKRKNATTIRLQCNVIVHFHVCLKWTSSAAEYQAILLRRQLD